MLRLALVPILFLGCSYSDPGGEFSTPWFFRVLALDEGKLLDERDAEHRCVSWAPPCAGPTRDPDVSCVCERHQLKARSFTFEWDAAVPRGARLTSVSGTVLVDGGAGSGVVSITKDDRMPFGGQSYYRNWAGTFEISARGRRFTRGVFYAVGP